MSNASIWFVRMAIDAQGLLLACGNMASQVFVFDLLAPSEMASQPKVKLRVSKEENVVSPSPFSLFHLKGALLPFLRDKYVFTLFPQRNL